MTARLIEEEVGVVPYEVIKADPLAVQWVVARVNFERKDWIEEDAEFVIYDDTSARVLRVIYRQKATVQ